MIGRFRTVQLTSGTVVIELKASADKRDRLPATLLRLPCPMGRTQNGQ
jgi:hypothetical protein